MPLWIALRFMLKGTQKGRFSPMTLFAWMAIGVGVATMTCLLSVMYGLETSLTESFLKLNPHVLVRTKTPSGSIQDYVSWTEKMARIDHVKRAVPYLETEMIVQSSRRTLGAVIRGLPAAEFKKIEPGLVDGGFPKLEGDVAQAVVGVELLSHLDVSNGDKMRLISPVKKGGILGAAPQSFLVEVSGSYASGHYETDKQSVLMLLEDVQDLLRKPESITGWQIWLDDLERADALAREIGGILPPQWEAVSWTSFNSALFASLKLEQLAMFVLLSIAVVIAVMNVSITLMMHVTHKRRNIGILRAMGATETTIKKVFIWQGIWMGAIGLGFGAVLSMISLPLLERFYKFPDYYYVTTLPFEIRPLSIGVIYFSAGLLIFLSTLYPAVRASRLDPVSAIRE